ncbi:MAG: hypothetical protein ACRDL4_20995 [Thermoleophilaceae bacterium]
MMTNHRFEAHATIRPGEHEHRLDGSGLQLVRIVLTDHRPVVAPDGAEHRRPDVVCRLRPSEARELAARLLTLAEHAETGAAR